MQTIKKPVSILLAVLMVVSLFTIVPITASAATDVAQIGDTGYETLQAALDAATDGQTVKLLADINDTAVRYPGEGNSRAYFIIGKKNLTLDGDGHKVTLGGRGFGVKYTGSGEGADITFKNIEIVNNASAGRAIDTRGSNLKSITLDNATLNCTAGGFSQALTIGGNQSTTVDVKIINGSKISDPQYYAIITFNPVNMTIEDSEITGWACLYFKAPDGSAGSAGSTVTVKNSVLTSENHNSGTTNSFSAIMIEDNDVTVEITDTEINISNDSDTVHQSIVSYQQNATLTGNTVTLGEGNDVTFTGPNAEFNTNNAPVEVTGGTFNQEVPEELCADDFIPKDNGDGTYGVKNGSYVAQVGDNKYETLAAAIDAAQDDDTVKLIADATETVTVSGKTLTLDLNGFNITSASSNKMAVNATNGAQLTINNSNTAKSENTPTQNAILGGTGTNNRGSLSASGEGTTVDICAGYYYGYNGNKTAIHAINGAKITFYDCVVNGAQGIDDTTAGKEGKVFYSGVNNPTKPDAETPGYIVVHGGVFNGRMSDSNWGNYLIDGGTFDRNSVVLNENPVDAQGNRVATETGSMTQLTISPGTLYESGWLAPGFAPVANGNTFTVDGPYAAMIGETGYATLAAAIAAAQANETIKLVANVTEAVSITGKTLTLDLNGFNITSPSSTQPIKAYGGTKLTITNSNSAKAENTPTQNAVLGSNGGTNNYGSLFASGEGTEVIINAGYYYGYNGDKTAIHAVNKATVTFNDCVVNGAAGFDGTGTTGKEGKVFYSGVSNPANPYATSPGTIIVHGGTFSGRMSDSNWGNYIIDGGTFDRNVVVINENPVDADGNRVATASGNMTKIKDGTFYDSNWLAPGFAPVANADGTFTVAEPYAARIGNTPYATFAEAVAARATNDDVITLLANYDGTYNMAPGKLVVDTNGFTFNKPTVTGAYVVIAEGNGTVYTYTTTEAEVKYTNTAGVESYKLASSLNSLSDGTYQLLKNAEVSLRMTPGTFTYDVTFDLNGFTLTSTAPDTGINLARSGSATKPRVFSLIDTSENKGGKLLFTATPSSSTAAITVKSKYNVVTIGEGVTVEGGAVVLHGANQTLIVNGTINGGNDFAIATNGSGTTNATIVINDGAVVTSNTIAAYLPSSGTTTINGGTITGTTAIYTKSGTLDIKGGTITGNGAKAGYTYNGNGANPTGDAIVVDSCGYPGGAPTVSIGGNPTITSTNGVEIGDYAGNGVTQLAAVTATDDSLTLPTGLEWVETETPGVYKVGQVLFPGYSVSVGGTITMNVYINTHAIPGYGQANNASATFTWDSGKAEYDDHYGDDCYTANLKTLTPDANGLIKVSVPVNAAQMANTITAKVTVNNTTLNETGTFSVKAYGETIINGNYDDDLKTLVKEMLNYGAMAQKVFERQLEDKPEVYANAGINYDNTAMNAVTSGTILQAVANANGGQTGASIDDLKEIGTAIGGEWYTTSVIFLDGNTIRHYFDDVNEDGMATDGATETDNQYIYYVEKKGIAANDLDKLFDFSIGGEEFQYSVLDYAAAVLENGNMGENAENLVKALFLYNQAANAYLG